MCDRDGAFVSRLPPSVFARAARTLSRRRGREIDRGHPHRAICATARFPNNREKVSATTPVATTPVRVSRDPTTAQRRTMSDTGGRRAALSGSHPPRAGGTTRGADVRLYTMTPRATYPSPCALDPEICFAFEAITGISAAAAAALISLARSVAKRAFELRKRTFDGRAPSFIAVRHGGEMKNDIKPRGRVI